MQRRECKGNAAKGGDGAEGGTSFHIFLYFSAISIEKNQTEKEKRTPQTEQKTAKIFER